MLVFVLCQKKGRVSMAEIYNNYQITRLDARGCFVESLFDAFPIGKIHLTFAKYDLSRPKGQRQTNNIQIYLSVDEFLELYRRLACGELRFQWQKKKENKDQTPLFSQLGGVSAEKLAKQGRARKDGKSLSRTVELMISDKGLMFIAKSGPGETTATGLIVPKFGNKPENHVVVSMDFEMFSKFILITHAHYQAWLASWYMQNPIQPAQRVQRPESVDVQEQNYVDTPMF